MSKNIIYTKSFGNQSGLTVDNINTTTINSYNYTNNEITTSGYITNIYSIISNQQNYLTTISNRINVGSMTSNRLNISNAGVTNSNSPYMYDDGTYLHIRGKNTASDRGPEVKINGSLTNTINITTGRLGVGIDNTSNGPTRIIDCNGNALIRNSVMASSLSLNKFIDTNDLSLPTRGTLDISGTAFISGQLTAGSITSSNGSLTILQSGAMSSLNMDGFYIRKETDGSVGLNMIADSTFRFYTNNGVARMTLDGGNCMIYTPINNGSNALTTGNITATASINILQSSGMSTLYLENFYIRKETSGDITFFTNSDRTMNFYTNSVRRMYFDSGGLVLTLPINAGSNTISCGSVTTASTTTPGAITLNGDTSLKIVGSSYTAEFYQSYWSMYNGSNSFYIQSSGGYMYFSSNNWDFNFTRNVRVNGTTLTSDDRIKNNECAITNATSIICQLRPEIYDKYDTFDCSGNFKRESGLIAQEVYNISDLRHLVDIPHDKSGNLITDPSLDPNADPNYNNWGTTSASLNYIGLIAYLVKSIQELNDRITVLESA